MAKKQNDYFQFLLDQVNYCSTAAQELHKVLTNFDPDHLSQTIASLHEIENEADQKKHFIMDKLIHEFITPIEREDIMALASEIDDVTDSVEDVLLKIYMFNVRSIKPEALKFVDVIVKCCDALKAIMEDFRHFKKSTKIKENIIEVNRLEEEGDKLYTESIRTLFTTCTDPMEAVAWTEVFRRLESCCDNCEDIADIVETVIMKNT